MRVFCRKSTEKCKKMHDFVQKMTKKSRPYFAKASKGYPVAPAGQPGKKDTGFAGKMRAIFSKRGFGGQGFPRHLSRLNSLLAGGALSRVVSR
jgi:hypothetical protein